MTGSTRSDGQVMLSVPNWMKGLLTTFLVGAVVWAWNMNAQMRELIADTKAMKELSAERFTMLKERIDRMDNDAKKR